MRVSRVFSRKYERQKNAGMIKSGSGYIKGANDSIDFLTLGTIIHSTNNLALMLNGEKSY